MVVERAAWRGEVELGRTRVFDREDEGFRKALEELSGRERFVVLCRRVRSGSSPPWTLQAVGNLLGISRERVRQIAVTASAKIIHHMKMRNVSRERG